MAEKYNQKNEDIDFLFETLSKINNTDEFYSFFADLCTIKELNDMGQRLKVAKLLTEGKTYEQIVKQVEISSATISRVNRCIQYGSGGYEMALKKK